MVISSCKYCIISLAMMQYLQELIFVDGLYYVPVLIGARSWLIRLTLLIHMYLWLPFFSLGFRKSHRSFSSFFTATHSNRDTSLAVHDFPCKSSPSGKAFEVSTSTCSLSFFWLTRALVNHSIA